MNFTALLTAGRVIECEEIPSLPYSDAKGRPFSLCIIPASGSTITTGDALLAEGTLPRTTATGDFPVIVGEWSPIVFSQLDDVLSVAMASHTIGTDYIAFAAPMTID